LIAGRIRGYENVKDNLGIIMNKYNPTVFCSLNKKNKSDYIKGFCDFMKIDDERLNLEPTPPVPEWYKTIELKHHGYNAPVRLDHINIGIHSQFYQAKKTFELLEKYQEKHNIKFDCIVHFRADVVSSDVLPLSKPKENTIYSPTFEGSHHDGGGITFGIFYGDFTVTKYACNILDSLKDLTEVHKVPFGVPETAFKKYLDNKNINIERFPYHFDLHPSRQIPNPEYNKYE
jgi:hypothetical protein